MGRARIRYIVPRIVSLRVVAALPRAQRTPVVPEPGPGAPLSRFPTVEGHQVEQDLVDQANDLYWGSDASVNRLAEELDLSKGALYDIIRPFPAGIPCPNGDGEMGYPNRTARDRGFVTCGVCGFEDEEVHVADGMERVGMPPETSPPRTLTPPRVGSGGRMLGSALVGVALGVLITGLVRRR